MNSNKATLLLPAYERVSQCHKDADHEAAGAMPLQAPAAFQFTVDLPQEPWLAQLAQCLNMEVAGGKRLPSARLCLKAQSADNGRAETDAMSHVVRADPVHLKADRDNATLIAPQQLQLSEAEADQILEALNDFSKDDGLSFFRHRPDTWFMQGMQAEHLETYPPSFLANRRAGSFLPEGDAAANWRRLLTEVQMLLHVHPVNQQREQRGLMPVNSVWFWGGAQLPTPDPTSNKIILYADDIQAIAFAKHSGMTTQPLSTVADALQDLPSDCHIVIVDTRIATAWLAHDEQELAAVLEHVNQHMLKPMSGLVAGGQLTSVEVLTEDGLQGLCNLQTMAASNLSVAGNSNGWLKRLLGSFRR